MRKGSGRRRRKTVYVEGRSVEQTFVLPRLLRRPARLLEALIDERIVIPRHTGSFAAAGLFALAIGYGVVVGGHLETMTRSLTASSGFGVANINVTGNRQTSPIDVFQQIGFDGESSLITLDVERTRALLLQMPWVADAEVRKVYPDGIDVKLTERKAFAIWQHGTDLSLIEPDGSVIAPMPDGQRQFALLPLFVGYGAERHAAEFNRLLAEWPDIEEMVKANIRVADRRWDLRLDNGITVLLPEHNAGRALGVLRTMQNRHALLDRDIKTVDLRLDDRVTIGLTEAAAKRRAEAIEQRDRELKKRSRST
jgi:cell division protein FtsQ